ncbi:MAG: DUF1573 domain-containing protein [Candidatus Doudnabacteria bacterium]|nr:DUF1573 domain-containing protein [Candidatus Doudnabacteria bacterium]
MKLKQIIYLTIVVLVVLGFAGFLKSRQPVKQQNASAQNSVLTADSNFYDFGSVPINGGKVEKIFQIRNPSDSSVFLKEMHTSCMCTEATLELNGQAFGPFGMPGHAALPQISMPLAASASANVKVVFDPAAHGPSGIGTIERVVTLVTSDGEIQFNIKANVTP